jgi:rRNA maturation RNase YbeY
MSNFDTPFLSEDDISFHFEEVEFDLLHVSNITAWLKDAISSKNIKLGFINFVFCNDIFLLDLNIKYLNHDTFTDVITFSYSDDILEGDIFISIDRIQENAIDLGVSFENELHRVIIHGVLHLLGFEDKTPHDKEVMTEKENEFLAILNGMIFDKF